MPKRSRVLIASFLVAVASLSLYLITQRPWDPDRWVYENKMGPMTALMVATKEGDLDEIRHQVNRGASLEKEGMLGHSSLHIAVYYKQYAAAYLLFELGADPNHIRELNGIDDGPFRMVYERSRDQEEVNFALFQAFLDAGAGPMFEDGFLVEMAAIDDHSRYLNAMLKSMPTREAADLVNQILGFRWRDDNGFSPAVNEVLARYDQ